MCGHVGVAGSMTPKIEQSFKELLTIDVIRGPHSTGICSVNHQKDVVVVKKPVLPTDLFSMKQTERVFFRQNALLLGHNRWATVGAINEVFAHPFEFEDLVGAHNGTLVSQHLLPDSESFKSDSENIFHSIQDTGVSETWGKIHGAAALVWYNKEHHSINFLRNDERPMYLTFTADRKTLFWASEAWMLEGVLAKNGIEHAAIFDTAVDNMYSMDIPLFGKAFDKTQIRKMTPYKVPEKKHWRVHGQGSTGTRTTQNSKKTEVTKTQAGGAYKIGENVYFTLEKIQSGMSLNAHPFIWAVESAAGMRVKLYCARDSWLRHHAAAWNFDSKLYVGSCNGWTIENQICIQMNSVFEVDEGEEDKSFEDDVTTAESNIVPFSGRIKDSQLTPEEREHMVKVISSSHGCAWCSASLSSHPEHVIVNHNTIICKDCKDLADVKEYLNT